MTTKHSAYKLVLYRDVNDALALADARSRSFTCCFSQLPVGKQNLLT